MWKSAKLFTSRGGSLYRSHMTYLWPVLVPSIAHVAKKEHISDDLVFPMATVIVDIVVAYRINVNSQLADPIKEITARAAEYFLTEKHFTNCSAHSNVEEEVDFLNRALLWWCNKHGIVAPGDTGIRVPQLPDETKMVNLIADLNALGAFSASRRVEAQSNFNNAHANFLCAIAKRGSATSQWCTKRTREFSAASGDDMVRLERGMVAEMWGVFSLMGVTDWGALIKFLTQNMIEMGLKDCAQVMRQAANSGHTSGIIIHRAVVGCPDFNWSQIITGQHTRTMRHTDPQFVDHLGDWYRTKMSEVPADTSEDEYARIDNETRAEALRRNTEQLLTRVTVTNKLLTTLKGELMIWRGVMNSLKEDPYLVFSHDHTGLSPQMRNLAYLCWKLCTDVMGDHSLTSYAGFKSGGIQYMREIDNVVADYESRL
ncbi:unnamed protein product [Boreogadus saida]